MTVNEGDRKIDKRKLREFDHNRCHDFIHKVVPEVLPGCTAELIEGTGVIQIKCPGEIDGVLRKHEQFVDLIPSERISVVSACSKDVFYTSVENLKSTRLR